MTTQNRKVLVCDNPECEATVILPEIGGPDDLPTGIYIKGGTIVRDNGYAIMKDVFACGTDCLIPAIVNAFERGTS